MSAVLGIVNIPYPSDSEIQDHDDLFIMESIIKKLFAYQ